MNQQPDSGDESHVVARTKMISSYAVPISEDGQVLRLSSKDPTRGYPITDPVATRSFVIGHAGTGDDSRVTLLDFDMVPDCGNLTVLHTMRLAGNEPAKTCRYVIEPLAKAVDTASVMCADAFAWSRSVHDTYDWEMDHTYFARVVEQLAYNEGNYYLADLWVPRVSAALQQLRDVTRIDSLPGPYYRLFTDRLSQLFGRSASEYDERRFVDDGLDLMDLLALQMYQMVSESPVLQREDPGARKVREASVAAESLVRALRELDDSAILDMNSLLSQREPADG